MHILDVDRTRPLLSQLHNKLVVAISPLRSRFKVIPVILL